VEVSTHPPPQGVAPDAHWFEVQAPTWHSSPAAHAEPHAPQFFGSPDVLEHRPAHAISPSGQAHVPPAQTWSPLQETPQPPQCAVSEARSRHAPEHALSPAAQDPVHSPLLQSGAERPHATPHPPQWAGSLVTSMQSVPHRLFPPAQAHVPPLQISLASHRRPQAPQSSMSLERSTQPPEHSVSPPLHAVAHRPTSQTVVAPVHVAPQVPQDVGSEWRFAQAPLQVVSPERRHAPFGARSPLPAASAPGKSSDAGPPQAPCSAAATQMAAASAKAKESGGLISRGTLTIAEDGLHPEYRERA
jgi:hypothetical protein